MTADQIHVLNGQKDYVNRIHKPRIVTRIQTPAQTSHCAAQTPILKISKRHAKALEDCLSITEKSSLAIALGVARHGTVCLVSFCKGEF